MRLPGTSEVLAWSYDEWEERVRGGRVPPDAEVRFGPVTGDRFVPAGELQMFRALVQGPSTSRGPWDSRVPLVTALLVGIQIRVWWWSRIPEVRDTVSTRFTSFSPQVLEDGEVWRLVSMGFLQVESMHLLMNMMWLAYVGWNLERTVGRAHLVSLYLASVLAGSVFSVFGSPWVPSLGSSGGVFGLVSAAAVFGIVRADLLGGRLARGFGLVMVPYLLLMFRSGLQNEGVDNWCHLGGLLCGALLGLVIDPPDSQRMPGWNRSVWAATSAAGALALAAVWLGGPRLHPLVDLAEARAVESRAPPVADPGYQELVHQLPAGWRTGRDLSGRGAWCSPAGPRCFGARAETLETATTAADRAAAWEAELREAWPAAVVGPPTPATVGGREGILRVARVDQAGLPLILEARFAVRGVHALEVRWQVEGPREQALGTLRDRLLEQVRWADPEALALAEEAHRSRPTPRTREALALALAEVGEVERALALHEEVLASSERDPQRAQALLETLRLAGPAAPDRERWLERAWALDDTPATLVALADALDAGGEPWTARALLTLAWDRAPGDRSLAKARRARELSRQVGPSGLPWDLEVDPVTRLPRSSAEVAARLERPLDLRGSRAFGDQLRSEQDALRAVALRRCDAEDPALLDDLVVLARGSLPGEEELAPARSDSASELLRAASGGAGASDPPPWADPALLASAAAHRAWLEALADPAGAPSLPPP